MEEWNLPADIRYSQLSDSELDRRVQQIKATNPNCGEVMLAAGLTAQNIHVQRTRLYGPLFTVSVFKERLFEAGVDFSSNVIFTHPRLQAHFSD